MCPLLQGVTYREAVTLITLSGPVVTIDTTRFKVTKFFVLFTECIYVFWVGLRQKQRFFSYAD
jgi:hypothetical protein